MNKNDLRAVFWLLISLVVMCESALGAAEDKLLGRWIFVSGQESLEFGYLQFEAGNRLFVEHLEEGRTVIASFDYRVEENQIFLPQEILDEPLHFEFISGNLQLKLDGDEPAIFERVKELRTYSSIARDMEMRVMQVEALDVNVEVMGARAITHVLYTIRNNHDEDVEAKIEIPLPEDALVIGYALNIGDVMIPGVAVPKEKARQTFEEIEDQEIDPGIAEIKRGNTFSTEIYPVPAKGTRKIRVSYSHSLDQNIIGIHSYTYPFSQIDSQAALSITISADGMRYPPAVKKSPFDSGVDWQEGNTGKRFYYANALTNSFKRTEQLEDFLARFSVDDDSDAVIATANDGHRYVNANLVIQEEMLKQKDEVKRITILWDASASMEEAHWKNVGILKRYLSSLRKKKLSGIEIQLLVFSNDIILDEKINFVDIKPNLVLDRLKDLVYDGATNFELLVQVSKDFKPDIAVLFSDGLSSLGSLSPLNIEVPTYVVASGPKTDLTWLYHSAYSNRGILLDTRVLYDKDIVELIGKEIPDIELRVNGDPVSLDITEWISVRDQIHIALALRLPKALTDIHEGTLAFYAEEKLLFVVPFEQRAVGELARYDWLRLQLNNLMGDLNTNEKVITELGMQYSLATPFTTLMVLENIDDYVEYGIRPPEEFPKAKSYDQLRKQYLADHDEALQESDIVAFLNEAWGERKTWWKNSKKQKLSDVVEEVNKKGVSSKRELANVDSPVREEVESEFAGSTEKAGLVERVSEGDSKIEEVVVAGMRASMPDGPVATTTIQAWSPERPYLEAIKNGDPKGKKTTIDIYFEQKKLFGTRPTFYMDVAHYFFSEGETQLATRVLTNVLEQHPENIPLERMVAYNLVQFNQLDAAISVLEHVKKLNGWEASSARDLANVWEKKARETKETADYQRAIDYYFEAITGPWELEEELRIVALMELNHLLASLKKENLNIPQWKSQLLENLDLDVRIVLSWNSRVADIDLWVKEPSGEYVSYNVPHSVAGGYLPFDITDGFGPEEYLTRFALEGDYEILVDLFSNRSVELFGPITLTLDIYTNYGKENETLQTSTVQLRDKGERIPVGSITWKNTE